MKFSEFGFLKFVEMHQDDAQLGKAIRQVAQSILRGEAPIFVSAERKTKKRSSAYSEAFETFWREFPISGVHGKPGKAKAASAFQDENLPKILASLEWQKQSEQWTKENGKYIPHPTTYLNQRRWEDEPPKASERKKVMDMNGNWV